MQMVHIWNRWIENEILNMIGCESDEFGPFFRKISVRKKVRSFLDFSEIRKIDIANFLGQF